MAVNCVAIAMETGYILVYLKHAVDQNFDFSWRVMSIRATVAAGVLIIIVPVVLLTRVWSVKVVGIATATLATGMFVVGIIDVVMLVKNQRSAFSIYQLLVNLVGACIWTLFTFLFDPVNDYIVVLNITGVAVILVQIIFHAVRSWKDRCDNRHGNNPPPAANRV